MSMSIVNRQGPRGRLGSLILAGRVERARGAPAGIEVRFPAFGCTYLFGGTGRYRDANHDIELSPGSLVTVVPGHPHWYGVSTQRGWDELFLVFDGPIFRTARQVGVLDASRPVHQLFPTASWVQRIDQFRTRAAPTTAAAREAEACEVLALLTAMVDAGPGSNSETMRSHWYERSLELLAADLGERVCLSSIAEQVSMPYDTWRRSFRRLSGTSPASYRMMQRINAASELLRNTRLSVCEIAAALGFTDEQHLNRRFRELHELTPCQYRRRDR